MPSWNINRWNYPQPGNLCQGALTAGQWKESQRNWVGSPRLTIKWPWTEKWHSTVYEQRTVHDYQISLGMRLAQESATLPTKHAQRELSTLQTGLQPLQPANGKWSNLVVVWTAVLISAEKKNWVKTSQSAEKVPQLWWAVNQAGCSPAVY